MIKLGDLLKPALEELPVSKQQQQWQTYLRYCDTVKGKNPAEEPMSYEAWCATHGLTTTTKVDT